MRFPDAQAGVDKWLAKSKNFPAWQVSQVSSNSELIKEAQANGKTGHFSTLLDPRHLKKNAGYKVDTYYGRDVLKGDSAMDDAVSFAVFTAKGASASQMSAAKI